MRELKGDWRDLFGGFLLALDLRKMFLAFCAILFTVFGPLLFTVWLANQLEPDEIQKPESFAPDHVWQTACQSWHIIYKGTTDHPPEWHIYVPYSIFFVLAVMAIWAYFGGAIARIAAYEIAKDGERIETARALRFGGKKFWSFFMSPWICVIGFLFFALCNLAGGALGRLLDPAYVGAPLVALLLPLALLSGFIMTLILIGTIAGAPLFHPAIATEGTDAFDAVSRGFSYVYSRPWHYLWYNVVSAVYGVVSVSFVILFAVTLSHLALKAGGAGFDLFWVDKAAKHDRFQDIADSAWGTLLNRDRRMDDYPWNPRALVTSPHPYGRTMALTNAIVDRHHHSTTLEVLDTRWHKAAAYIAIAWLIITLGLAVGYLPSYVISQQTLIYMLLRKKVDGIELTEVYEEPEEQPLSPTAPTDKPLVTEKPVDAGQAKPSEAKPPETPKT